MEVSFPAPKETLSLEEFTRKSQSDVSQKKTASNKHTKDGKPTDLRLTKRRSMTLDHLSIANTVRLLS
jgi:hypothetical protein